MSIVKSTLGLVSTHIKPSNLDFSRNSIATRINSIGLVETVPANTIRHDYRPNEIGQVAGWLLEKGSENLCLYSADMSNAVWGSSAETTVVQNNHISPDGSPTVSDHAVRMHSTGAGTHRVYVKQDLTSTLPSGQYTNGSKFSISVYAKKASGSNFLEISNELNSGATQTFSQTFDLENGTVGSFTGAVVTSRTRMVSYPNDWYRCEVTFTADGSSNPFIYLSARMSDGNSTDEAFSITDGIYVWGSQVEHMEYPTSYIPTTDATVVRVADEASYTVSEEDYNWNVGCGIVFRGTTYGGDTASPLFHYGNSEGVDGGVAFDNAVTLYNNGTIKVVKDGESQTGVDPATTAFTMVNNTEFAISTTLDKTRLQLCKNMVLGAGNMTDGTLGTVNIPMNVEGSNFVVKFFHGDNSGSGHLKNFMVVPHGLTDPELQVLTLADNGPDFNTPSSGTALTEGSVTEAHLSNGAVTGNKIANNSITSAHLGLDVIVATDIADNAIGVGELSNDAVETIKIKDGNVTEAKIADNAISESKLANDSVTGDKINLAAGGSEAGGDIMYHNGTGWVRLPKGQDGYILKASENAPHIEWAIDQGAAPTSPNTPLGGHADSHISGTLDNPQIKPSVVDIVHLETANAGSTGQALMKNASGKLEFGDVSADPTMGGDLSGLASNAQLVANCVTNTEIANTSISTSSMQDDCVDADKLKDSTTTDNDRAVTTNHVRNSAITADKLASDSVTSDKLADDAILSAHLADNSVIEAHITNSSITNAKIGPLAVTNSKLATDAVTNSKIADGAITAGKIAAGVIVAQDIADNSVGIPQLNVNDGNNGQVLTTDGNGVLSFTTPAAGDPAVGGAFTGTVSNIAIPDNTITSAMIAADVIVASDLADNAIGIAELQDGAVVTAKLADNAVTGAKIAMGSDAAGDIMYFDGTDYTRLPVGTSGQVLTMNTGGSAPEWAATSSNASTTSMGGDLSGTVENAQIIANAVTIAELAVTDGSAGQVLQTDGAGNLSFTTPASGGGTDVAMAIALG